MLINWRDAADPKAGGSEVYVGAVARELAEQGLAVTLVVNRPPGTLARERVDGMDVVRLGATFTVYPLVLAWLARHRREIDAVIDTQNGIPFFSPLALSRRTPVVLLIHHVHQEQFSMYFPRGAARVGQWLESTGSRWVYGRRPVVAISPSSRTDVRRKLRLGGRITVAASGQAPVRVPEVSRAEAPRIVCVGRLVPHKRWDVLVRACAQLRASVPDLELHLIGSGEQSEALAALVETLGLQEVVRLHGRVSDAVRDELLASAWLTATSSAGEGWGLGVIEAAAFGVPSVASDVPGLRDSVVPGVTGWLVPDALSGADVEAWVKAIGSALEDVRADHASWAERCRSWADSFRWSDTAQHMLDVLTTESDRLLRGAERRGRSDLGVVVHLEGATDLPRNALRRTDRAGVGEDGGSIYLPGADEHGARAVLVRLGLVPEEGSDRPAALIRVARSLDLLGRHRRRDE